MAVVSAEAEVGAQPLLPHINHVTMLLLALELTDEGDGVWKLSVVQKCAQKNAYVFGQNVTGRMEVVVIVLCCSGVKTTTAAVAK